jgi:hypothetical protein
MHGLEHELGGSMALIFLYHLNRVLSPRMLRAMISAPGIIEPSEIAFGSSI